MNMLWSSLGGWQRHTLLASLLVTMAGLVIACGGGGSNKGGGTAEQSAKIGEEVAFKDSKWTVLATENKGKSLKAKNQFQKDAQTDGKFILVRFKVTNNTNKEERILGGPKLVDAQGREFQQYDHQSFYLPEGAESMGLKALPASMTKEFQAIYEVPADAADIKFQARALSAFGDKKLVDLGL